MTKIQNCLLKVNTFFYLFPCTTPFSFLVSNVLWITACDFMETSFLDGCYVSTDDSAVIGIAVNRDSAVTGPR